MEMCRIENEPKPSKNGSDRCGRGEKQVSLIQTIFTVSKKQRSCL